MYLCAGVYIVLEFIYELVYVRFQFINYCILDYVGFQYRTCVDFCAGEDTVVECI